MGVARPGLGGNLPRHGERTSQGPRTQLCMFTKPFFVIQMKLCIPNTRPLPTKIFQNKTGQEGWLPIPIDIGSLSPSNRVSNSRDTDLSQAADFPGGKIFIPAGRWIRRNGSWCCNVNYDDEAFSTFLNYLSIIITHLLSLWQDTDLRAQTLTFPSWGPFTSRTSEPVPKRPGTQNSLNIQQST